MLPRITKQKFEEIAQMTDEAARQLMASFGYRPKSLSIWAKYGGTARRKVDTTICEFGLTDGRKVTKETVTLVQWPPLRLMALKVYLAEFDGGAVIWGRAFKMVINPIWDNQVDIWPLDSYYGDRVDYYTAIEKGEVSPDVPEPLYWFTMRTDEQLTSMNAYDIVARIETRTARRETVLRAAFGISQTWRRGGYETPDVLKPTEDAVTAAIEAARNSNGQKPNIIMVTDAQTLTTETDGAGFKMLIACEGLDQKGDLWAFYEIRHLNAEGRNITTPTRYGYIIQAEDETSA